MSAYQEFRHYSPVHDAEMVRLSMCDRNQGEFFRIIPADPAKGYRARRDDALDAIEEAIAQGCEPGEVRIR